MKMKQVRELTDAELDHQIDELRKDKFKVRQQAKTGQLENPAKVKGIRQDIARLLTDKKRRETAAAAK
jgi:large subunit ribosomal protein L29